MDSGWFKFHRKTTSSLIWQMPPMYLKVWIWLLQKANHEERRVPTTNLGVVIVGRGQVMTSLDRIAEAVKHKDRNKIYKPAKKTIQRMLQWLEKQGMIVLERTYKTEGGSGQAGDKLCQRVLTLITIVNWDTYNDRKKSNVKGCDTGGIHKQELYRRTKRISCPNLKTLKAFLASQPEFENLPQNTQTLLVAFLDGVRQSNKTKTISSGRLCTLLGSIFALVGETTTSDVDHALKITLDKIATNGWFLSKHNPSAYVGAIAKNTYSKRQAEQQRKYEPPPPITSEFG